MDAFRLAVCLSGVKGDTLTTDARAAGGNAQLFRDPRAARAAQGGSGGHRAARSPADRATRARAGGSARVVRVAPPQRVAQARLNRVPPSAWRDWGRRDRRPRVARG